MAFTYTKGKYLGDPEYHLDRALFFYYNQNPNYPPYKPCSQPNGSHKKISYQDKCPSYFYRVCDKISSGNRNRDNNCVEHGIKVGPYCEHQIKCNCGNKH